MTFLLHEWGILDRGVGVVYKAEDTKLKRAVALKSLSGRSGGDEPAWSPKSHLPIAAADADKPRR